jgi:DNA invertase Pin-like site-specific DNA recombinase
MKLRAVFYARVSTDEEKQLNALEKQIQENKDVIEDMGWELVGFYIDEGKTGTTTKRRNDYKKMLRDIEEDLFDIVVCKDQDRLQRNTLDWYLFVDKMVTNGKRLYLYLDHKFFTPEEDALITGVKAIIAEEYSRNLSKKLNNANKRRVERAKRGEGVSAMGNGKSLGFAIKDNKWVQVPEEIELCKIIWDLYDEFDSIRKVRDWVNSHGYTNSVGKPFTSESISRILKNEKAKGVIVLGKYHHDFNLKKIVRMPEEDLVRVDAPELAYVSAERFDRVQERLKSKTSNGRGKYNGSDPLSGKIFCGKCGGVMWKHSSNGYTGWFCSSSMAKGDIVCEGDKTTTVKIRNVYKQIAEGLEVNKNAVKASIMEWLENLKKELSKDDLSRNASRELQRAQNKKEKLLEVYLEGIISKDDYRAKYEALEAIIKEQEKLLAPLEENEAIKEIEETLKNIDSEIDAYVSDPSFENNKIDFLIEHTQKITVNGKHLIIELDLIAGAIIAGKDFLLFVHDKVYYCEHITNYRVELRLVA